MFYLFGCLFQWEFLPNDVAVSSLKISSPNPRPDQSRLVVDPMMAVPAPGFGRGSVHGPVSPY